MNSKKFLIIFSILILIGCTEIDEELAVEEKIDIELKTRPPGISPGEKTGVNVVTILDYSGFYKFFNGVQIIGVYPKGEKEDFKSYYSRIVSIPSEDSRKEYAINAGDTLYFIDLPKEFVEENFEKKDLIEVYSGHEVNVEEIDMIGLGKGSYIIFSGLYDCDVLEANNLSCENVSEKEVFLRLNPGMFRTESFQIKGSPIDCEKKVLKSDCYSRVAIALRDPSYCKQAGESLSQLPCFTKTAVTLEDPEICSNLDSFHRDTCLMNAAKETSNHSFCSGIQDEKDRGSCYKDIAIRKEDSSICDLIDPEWNTIRVATGDFNRALTVLEYCKYKITGVAPDIPEGRTVGEWGEFLAEKIRENRKNKTEKTDETNWTEYCETTYNDVGECPKEHCSLECTENTTNCSKECVLRNCIDFPIEDCPLKSVEHNCQTMINCDGKQVCFPEFKEDSPECGDDGFFGQGVDCCEGYVRRCGQYTSDGRCWKGVFRDSVFSYPICYPCGDGFCDVSLKENDCNCPEDCSSGKNRESS